MGSMITRGWRFLQLYARQCSWLGLHTAANVPPWPVIDWGLHARGMTADTEYLRGRLTAGPEIARG